MRERSAGDRARIRRGFVVTSGREPEAVEEIALQRFLEGQRLVYAGKADAELRVWSDLSQSLFGLNSFLYLE